VVAVVLEEDVLVLVGEHDATAEVAVAAHTRDVVTDRQIAGLPAERLDPPAAGTVTADGTPGGHRSYNRGFPEASGGR
jgi:hypothetical protein